MHTEACADVKLVAVCQRSLWCCWAWETYV